MIATIVKNKFHDLSIEPSFSKEKIIFFRINDPPSDMEVGQMWEFEVGEETNTGKTDRRDVPIYNVFLEPITRQANGTAEELDGASAAGDWVDAAGNRATKVCINLSEPATLVLDSAGLTCSLNLLQPNGLVTYEFTCETQGRAKDLFETLRLCCKEKERQDESLDEL